MLQKRVDTCLEALNIKNVYNYIHLYPNVYKKIMIDDKNIKKNIKI